MLQPRGRSRHVSNAALARQASEERRSASSAVHRQLPAQQKQPPIVPILAPVPVKATCPPSFMRFSSPSPSSSASMSPDYYDSPAPGSPPPSLEDQVHVAYALDDIHLAKILLLRLKGIEVTSDDDPRIAAVQDEDFDFCFVPNGRLMDEADEKAIKVMQARELEHFEERRRFERLRTCERIWDDQKRRMREERLAVFRQRERKWMEEEDRRRKTEQQQKRDEERRRAQKAAVAESQRATQRTRARLVCYDNLPCSSQKRVGQQFVYDFMVPSAPSSPKSASSSPPSLSHSRPRLRGPVFDDSRSVPFTAVLDSMQGPLFPISNEELVLRNYSSSTSRSTSRTHSQAIRRREGKLLDALLVGINRTEDEWRNRKGKRKAQPRRSLPCLACSAASTPTSPLSPAPSITSTSCSSSSSISRTSSWLSFAGASSPSPSPSSSNIITPPTSPTPSVSSSKPGWFKSTTVSSLTRPKAWIATSNLLNPRITPLRHSCKPHSRFTPVLSSESPLPLNPPHLIKSFPMSHPERQRSRAAKEGAGLLVRRMSRFVELAKDLHQTYVNMALSNLTEPESWDTGSGETHIFGVPDPNSSMHMGGGSSLRAPGYRANQRDVTAFLNMSSSQPSSSSSDESPGPGLDVAAASNGVTLVASSTPPPPKYIPLRSPFPPSSPPRTVLPDPLPYPLVFKPIPMPIRSPFRCHAPSELHTTYPSIHTEPSSSTDLYNLFSHQGPLTWRIRSVGNPAYLKLKALHNVVRKGGMLWEGRGRDTALGGGRERIVGVAYDGVGRSSLSWQVKVSGG